MYAKHGKLRQPHCRLTVLPTRIIDLHFAADSMDLSLLKFLWQAM